MNVEPVYMCYLQLLFLYVSISQFYTSSALVNIVLQFRPSRLFRPPRLCRPSRLCRPFRWSRLSQAMAMHGPWPAGQAAGGLNNGRPVAN